MSDALMEMDGCLLQTSVADTHVQSESPLTRNSPEHIAAKSSYPQHNAVTAGPELWQDIERLKMAFMQECKGDGSDENPFVVVIEVLAGDVF